MKSFFSSLTVFAISLSLLASAQAASNSTNGPSCGVAKPDDSYFSVVGVQGTGVQPRQELRELQKDRELWNMFLQAFSRFQAMDQSEKTSYYQVAGIHGAPFGQWDKVKGQPGQEMMGYCPHTSNIFGTWHRPYLALFEQILHDRAVEIAHEYPIGEARNRALAIAARSEFRFKDWGHTIRYPLHPYAVNATSRDVEVNVRVGKQQPSLRDMLYKLLTIYQPFSQVSNKASGGTIGNVETLHDGLHNVFGLGHMGVVEVSAFDAVFWFHHCNIDRILAIYQARYPDTWIEDAKQATGSFAVARGSVLGTASPLAPFHMNALGDMWTSTTSRNWTSFGYTYPEVANNPDNATLTSSINRLYKPKTQGLSNINATHPVPGGNSTNATAQATDWLCQVNLPTDIKISYSVRAFLGEPSTNPVDWPTDPNYVGQIASMSSPRMSSSVVTTGNIVLTEKLAQKHASGELKSLDKETVAAYLKEKFSWRIQALDYTEIPRTNPPAGLNVTVFNVPVSIPKSDTEVPTWNGQIEYNEEIHGNPPVYNGPGLDGTNSTLPAGQSSGIYNPATGEFEWKNATNAAIGGGAAPVLDIKTETSLIKSTVTQHLSAASSSGAFTSVPTSGVISASSVVEVSSASPTSQSTPSTTRTMSFAKVSPRPTKPADPQTAYVTSVIYEYVTV
ncbi:tyrosinase [Pyrenophora tritici-repentis Pt-1C-BFP]|uniref:tyrosinase n=1 Tax=Pyrenophora tritici-repentis (strain Pt-1C-BFP) TaxID=426418 RepID=B2VW57_PYRTR|nr:tyrosinase [Pyrenophora tritici-repentis Pt-1C-BFP]EDU40857.1 tyrosinase [Pyrenophora tritici-repentis Pt-1C-BFP]